jgi:hypothetical protein
MRKNIDIPEDYIEALQMLCVKEKTNPKKWIEKIVIRKIDEYWRELGYYVKVEKKEQKTSTNVKSKRYRSNGA